MKVKVLAEIIVDIQDGLSKPLAVDLITQDLNDRLNTSSFDPSNVIQYNDLVLRLYVPDSSLLSK
jgi:hypothetical protein